VSIKYVILGFLSESAMTGYDLKKKFSSSEIFHWSGNNNQIYTALVELHEEKLVTLEVQYQESKPPRKLYSLTPEGLAALRQWLQSSPKLPQFQNALLIQLTWADQLTTDELRTLLMKYEEDLQIHIAMLREQGRRTGKNKQFTFADRAAEHWVAFYELELKWVQTLRQELDGS
jgi:PadR family transcriptional regulator, regulatory protein AphA